MKAIILGSIPISKWSEGDNTMEELGIPFIGKEKTIDGISIINLLRDINYGDLINLSNFTILRDINYGDLSNLPKFTFKQSPKFSYGDTEVDVYTLTTSDGFLKYITTVKSGDNPNPVVYVSDMHLSLFNTRQYAERRGIEAHYVGEPIYTHIMQMIDTYKYV